MMIVGDDTDDDNGDVKDDDDHVKDDADDKIDCDHQSVLTDGTRNFIKDQRLRYFSARNQLK